MEYGHHYGKLEDYSISKNSPHNKKIIIIERLNYSKTV